MTSSSPRKFLATYQRIVFLAYQTNPSLLTLITIINAFWGLTNLPVLYINKILIDLVIANLDSPDWTQAAWTIVFVIALRSVIEFVRNFLSRYNYALSSQMFMLISHRIDLLLGVKLNSLDIPTIESPEFQDKYKKITRESNSRAWGMISPLSDVPNSVFTIFSGLVPLWSFNPVIGLLVVLVSLPEALINGRLAKWDYHDRDKINKENRLLGWLAWMLSDTSQIYDNKLYATVDYVSKKLRLLQDHIYDINRKIRQRWVKWRTCSDIPAWLLVIGLNSYFYILALTGRISLGLAQMLYQSSNTLANGFSMLTRNIAEVYENYLFMEDFVWFLDLPPKFKNGAVAFPKVLSTGIIFDHVWFKYPSSSDWILKDISFSIGPRENVAIVGENGSGKTTLLKLLLGFYQPQKGQILIDNVKVSDYDSAGYWGQIATLHQDFSLYPFTARESIALSDISRANKLEDIRQAAKLAEVDSYIESLSLKYETPLNKELENGVDPSGGQKQRIGLARALFKKSQILILDEPTSHIDPKAEEEIFENIISLTRDQILILVSHRFSTVRRADKILVMESGRLTEQGTHKELMKQKGIYSKLFTLQAKSYH